MNLTTYNELLKRAIEVHTVLGVDKHILDPMWMADYREMADDAVGNAFTYLYNKDLFSFEYTIYQVFEYCAIHNYLHTGFDSTVVSMKRVPQATVESLGNLLADMGSYLVDGYVGHVNVMQFFSIVERLYGNDVLMNSIERGFQFSLKKNLNTFDSPEELEFFKTSMKAIGLNVKKATYKGNVVYITTSKLFP